ncbi:amino acid adenylation domain-containing protein, partial [Chitinophaga sp. RAB17]|uniref:amino acid adenylation domain-containing protein n=1 Tax=Chitinophaga sp. RAB17 TaxID=3233049 RepID=UPI003F917EC5
ALVFEGTALTYKALNERANQLGDYLRQQYHIQAGDLAGIQLGRSEQMVIAILGILKSGGAYVPVDPEYPADRIDYMIADSQCKVVIDEEELLAFSKNADGYTKQNLAIVSRSDDPAYVIYTSGTTGRPKGTLITHSNVVRLFKNDQPLFDFNASDVWTLFHSYCFDFSVWEMYGALLFGGKLIVVPSLTARDPQAFITLLNREGVTVLNQTPSAFYNIIKEAVATGGADLQLRYVIFGGEALSPGKLKSWKARYPDTKLINMYGITETTVHVTYKEITEEEISKNISNIGIPIPTLSCYVLDQHQQLLPPGIPGELYVGGAGVAKGYLNRDDLNRQRFIENPFKAGERLYRSGDTVKISAGWELEYLGRIDAQVKIRGYRIELGEIENAIQEHTAVTAAVVIARSNAEGDKELVAYIAGSEALNTPDMRAWLGRRLPDYMIPGYFVQLDALPLTSNGKVDKKRLPAPESLGMETGIAYVMPRNETEEKLTLIWQELLGKEKIGVNDNFYELGGHSFLMIRLLNKVNTTFEKAGIRLIDLMQQSTIALLGALIDAADSEAGQPRPHIITLRDGNETVPTFIIPGMPGISDGYLELAQQLPVPGAVYGLQMKGLIAAEAPLESIEAMAAHNIDLIRTIRPSGTIRLFAHSYGGTVVYEMLKQLKNTGITVTDVVLIESVPAGQPTGADKQAIGRFLDNFFDENGLATEKQRFSHLWTLCEKSLSIKYDYTEKLPYTITLIVADDQRPRMAVPTGWEDHFQQVNIVHTAGDHFSVVKEPYCSGWLANLIY